MKNFKIFKNPYILIGDVKDKHQPFYKEYTKPPRLILNSPMLCCPFQENKRFRTGPTKKSKKPGYCEVCYTKYNDYNQHVLEYEHREFAKDHSNFLKVDFFINNFNSINLNEEVDSMTVSLKIQEISSDLAYENILNISKVSTDNEEGEMEYENINQFLNSIKKHGM
ncbi:Protein DBF4 like protein A [Nosema bombycis CQ1]|uniref:Protein DBF4 like protein A n=1 Tax=Nosema bombycis (strain CQ1 / CVCC 102059) TaxID=578461 RepID=R0MIF4_NOSB1|nr:Protein DBF4 like protein A [Nosema bombycis CQ1]|eukprot:EOB13920.1 Protein DBF4 like protein A [Nosema bombycis CQ1]